jgi:hypothetical protein
LEWIVDEITTCVFPWCEADISELISLPLCNRHIAKVYRRAQMLISGTLPRREVEALAPRSTVDTPGAIYFIRLGSLVKIGFSTSLAQRLRDLPHEEVLGVIAGTMRDEKALHARFAHLRQTGEWFRQGDDLMEFIGTLNRAA